MPPPLNRNSARSPNNGDDGGGGFFQPASPTANNSHSHGLLSPATSTASSSVFASGVLPKPRSQPLRSGGTKESTFINYMDREVMGITRRFAKKFGDGYGEGMPPPAHVTENAAGNAVGDHSFTNAAVPSEPAATRAGKNETGYTSFTEVTKDVDRLVNVLWVSGTPSLQIQYLLTLALLVVSYVPAFPVTPKAMFRVLDKLDYAFASLITGRDVESGETLPGFGFGERTGLSATEKVRVKSLVERTRVVVVEVMADADEIEEEGEDEDDEPRYKEDGPDEIDVDDMGGDWGMAVARVYDRIIVELGDTIVDEADDAVAEAA